MILGDKETGRSSCATTIYDHYKEKKAIILTISFTPEQVSIPSRDVRTNAKIFILQILSQDRQRTQQLYWESILPTLKLFFVMAIELHAKSLMSIGKRLSVLDGLEHLTDPEGKRLTAVDWLPQRMPTNIDLLVTSDTESAVTNGFFSCF